MRILFLTNFYPPYELGGQGQSCQQVVEGLQQRGHSTAVLTSMHGTNNVPQQTDGIYRLLYLEMDLVPWRQSINFFTRRKQREQHNLQCLDQLLKQFKPDIVFIWGMWNLPRSLPALAEAQCSDKVVYRFGDYWPTLPSQHEEYWRVAGRNWLTQFPKKLLGFAALTMLARDQQLPPLKFEHAICISATVRKTLVEANVPVAHAQIIYNGIDVETYLSHAQPVGVMDKGRRLELLYVGRLSPEKGVDTAINAMARLVFDQRLKNVKLSLVGSGSTACENHLRHLVTQERLKAYVSFLGRVPSETMPSLLQRFDVLLVPSIWPEPFGRVVLEGLVSNLVVLATPTGGPGEIIVDGENGLLFKPNDAEDLAKKIVCLAADPELRRKLAQAGQRTVMEKFTVTRMLDEIEDYLQEIARGSVAENVSKEVLFSGVVRE